MISSDLETRLIKELELRDITPATRQKILEKSSTIINQKITLRVLEGMSERDKAECDVFLEKEGTTSETLLSFFSTRIPRLDLIVEESFQEVLKDIKLIVERAKRPSFADRIEEETQLYIESERTRFRLNRISKIVSWVVGFLVSYLALILLAKLGIIPMNWAVPNWVLRIFQSK